MTSRTYHLGRLIDHVHIVVSDIEKSRAFYKAVFASIGRELSYESETEFESDELFVSQRKEGQRLSCVHIALQVADAATVDRFYQAGVSSGGVSNGEPGERSYHKGYYAAFVLDPDGNNIEAVFHGETERSADSVIVSRK